MFVGESLVGAAAEEKRTLAKVSCNKQWAYNSTYTILANLLCVLFAFPMLSDVLPAAPNRTER